LIELLRRAAAQDADRPAIVLDEYTRSYGELVHAAESVAAALTDRGIRRFASVEHDAATAAALLAGASLAGAEACQYPPIPADADTAADEIIARAQRFDHEVVVAARALELPGLTSLAASELTGTEATRPAPPEHRPHLVLTTGTTGTPRGVLHDWNRLLRATQRIAPGAGQRWLLAYGLHQFAGLHLLLHVFAAGATLIAPAPRRPREGLAAMRAHGVTHASATPTYWRFLLAELHADGGPVPALTQLTLGGEPIPGPLLDELAGTFPSAHISQVYAASEFGSTGSVRDGRNGLTLEMLQRGEDADVAMKVVDGELWVRSRVGMLGYYGQPAVDADGWRATGDLVEIVDGRIQFRGRSSEIINVGGVKVHPLPIEELVATVPGVALARAFGRPNPLTGSIVALEVVATTGAEQGVVEAAIRGACAELPAAARPRSIRFVDAIATAGDKIARASA
jgi:acyl-CoA synthetase (AMP-forming)/AMP-acid ligase II